MTVAGVNDESSSRGERVRRGLIEAAFRIIAEQGVAGISHRAVARESGTSHGLVTYHFGAIEGLLRATMEYVGAANLADQERYFPQLDAATSAEQLVAVLTRNAERRLVKNRDMGLALMELRLAAARNAELRPLVREWGRGYTLRVAAALQRLGAASPREDAAEITALISGLVVDQLSLPRPRFLSAVLQPALARRVRASLN
ncbi:TetR/AcrR family transcriptional regulator [Alloalcanivorax mobilis]|uniref:TetR/AcrR family transcriptional regulator n=1 Tax=Alloalcanivorax mobilis TaxID=2019569 RepID=UPI000C771A3F|nr:TetR family transcriptional regulator [Alloalcanivorax mobilis]